jgi:hypothetical protein
MVGVLANDFHFCASGKYSPGVKAQFSALTLAEHLPEAKTNYYAPRQRSKRC